MRFIASASALLAMTTAALAQTADFDPIYTPEELEEVPAGTSFEVTWSAPAKYTDGTISIHLIGGADQNTLVPIQDIASGIANSDETYSWEVDASLGAEALYGLVFKLESNPEIFQYSLPFHIKTGSDKPDDNVEIVTKTTGIKTVTLSSCPPEETSTTSAIVTPSSTPIVTPTSTWSTLTSTYNSTTSAVTPTLNPTTPIIEPIWPTTTVVDVPPPPPTGAPSEVPSPVPTGAAARYASGPLALVGGVVVVLLL